MRLAGRWFVQNLGLLLLALSLSVITWIVANYTQNPDRTDYFSAPIPIELTKVPEGILVLNASPAQVTLRLRAPEDSWARLRPASFKATVDLSKAEPGLHDVDVAVECADRRVRILEKIPDRISVRLEAIVSRDVPVRVVPLDEAPPGYTLEAPQPNPVSVTVSGASSVVNQVAEAVVDIRIEGSKVSFTKLYQPVLLDAQGKEVNGLDFTPPMVQVQVTIKQLENYKTVSVKAVLTGTVAPGYWVSNIIVEPATVTFGGDATELESFGYVETAPVDVTGAISDVIRTVSIYVPPGTALVGKQQPEVFVKVSVEPIPGGQIVRRPLVVDNLAKGLTITYTVTTVDITLAGPIATMLNLQATDVTAVIDATGLLTGTYELQVQVSALPKGLTVTAIIPNKVSVKVQ
jgi:YbbR domain-containing protein